MTPRSEVILNTNRKR